MQTAASIPSQQQFDDAIRPGVIWISGYSAAGKTSVGRALHRLLTDQTVPTVYLDGDDLRSIFAGRWGYERADRIELARVYFRLCSHLASQGLTVVISAVAMYDEVREWFRSTLPHSIEVYLDVPEEERRRRDAGTKRVYDKVGRLADMYDEPKSPDLSIRNYGEATPEQVADEILRFYRSSAVRETADAGRTEHWRSYYRQNTAPLQPSSFAREVARQEPPGRLLEVGCGNGRDAVFFAGKGFAVTAIDASESAIELCRNLDPTSPISFLHGSLPQIAVRQKQDVVYSRFCLHAMTEPEEVAMLKSAARILDPGGRLLIECRSINDPLASKGEVISLTERIHGHYRRFIVKEELRGRVEAAGFIVESLIESGGLSALDGDDPVVIRLEARRI